MQLYRASHTGSRSMSKTSACIAPRGEKYCPLSFIVTGMMVSFLELWGFSHNVFVPGYDLTAERPRRHSPRFAPSYRPPRAHQHASPASKPVTSTLHPHPPPPNTHLFDFVSCHGAVWPSERCVPRGSGGVGLHGWTARSSHGGGKERSEDVS